jgi:streptogramin lyase
VSLASCGRTGPGDGSSDTTAVAWPSLGSTRDVWPSLELTRGSAARSAVALVNNALNGNTRYGMSVNTAALWGSFASRYALVQSTGTSIVIAPAESGGVWLTTQVVLVACR